MKLEICNVSKKYREKTALYGIDLVAEEGVHALLGPNGSGKTTLMNILAGILRETTGKVLIDDKSIDEIGPAYRELLGYMPQEIDFYPSFSVYEIMRYYSIIRDVKEYKERIALLLKAVNLEDEKKTKVRALSGGMKRRLAIAVTLLNNPYIVIFDEPTAGLDPMERMRFKEIITQLGRSRIIFVATHIVSDIEDICDDCIILKEGMLHKYKSVKDLCDELNGMVWEIRKDDYNNSSANEFISAIEVKHNKESYVRIISKSKPFERSLIVNPSLDDVYMSIFTYDNQGMK